MSRVMIHDDDDDDDDVIVVSLGILIGSKFISAFHMLISPSLRFSSIAGVADTEFQYGYLALLDGNAEGILHRNCVLFEGQAQKFSGTHPLDSPLHNG